jgi:hypothetical protein
VRLQASINAQAGKGGRSVRMEFSAGTPFPSYGTFLSESFAAGTAFNFLPGVDATTSVLLRRDQLDGTETVSEWT